MALKCQDKGGDGGAGVGAGSMLAYLQTGIRSGRDGEWRKIKKPKTFTDTKHQATARTFNACLTDVYVFAHVGGCSKGVDRE